MSNNNNLSFQKMFKGNNQMNVGSSTSSKGKGMIVAMVIIGALLVLYFYMTIKGYYSFVNNSPMLIQNTISGDHPMKIDSYKMPSPSDGKYGTEYSYSFWIYMKDSNFNNAMNGGDTSTSDYIDFRHIFHKGSSDVYQNATKKNFPLLQSPGVWMYPNENKLNIRFNTYNSENNASSIYETCDIGNIPINKWVHITIVLLGNSVDIYVNCNLKKRQKLSGVPKLNDGDLFVNNYGGFQGYLSRLRYYNYAIDPFELDLICKMGPSENTPTDDLGKSAGKGLSYLSPNYWFNTTYPIYKLD